MQCHICFMITTNIVCFHVGACWFWNCSFFQCLFFLLQTLCMCCCIGLVYNIYKWLGLIQNWNRWRRDLLNSCWGRICLVEERVFLQLWHCQMHSQILQVCCLLLSCFFIWDMTFFFLSWSNHDVQTLCCSFHFQERLIAEMFQIIHCQFLSFFSYWECSCCFWRAKASRADAPGEEGKMEKRNWLASISHWLHCWNGSCATEKQGWLNDGGNPLSFLMLIILPFTIALWFINLIFGCIGYDNTTENWSPHEYPCLKKAWYHAYCKIRFPHKLNLITACLFYITTRKSLHRN